MRTTDFATVVILRVTGVAALLAIPAIFIPCQWMNAIHGWLGLGDMPDTPIVGYLARSLSLFYAMFGAISVFASFDLPRYRSLVRLLALLAVLTGMTLLWIDHHVAMPMYWMLTEGPFTIMLGATLLWLQSRSTR